MRLILCGSKQTNYSPFGGNEPYITDEAVRRFDYKTIHVNIDYQC